MKKLILFSAISFLVFNVSLAQLNLPALDKSILDESYCPNNFPLLKIQDKVSEPLLARVIYSRPVKNGRVIFGDLIEYGKLWRLGANEATEIEFFQNIKMGDAKIKKGRYTLYAIPAEKSWAIILNKETDTWGSFKYDPKKDVARMEVPVKIQPFTTEAFTITFDKGEKGYDLQFYWDNVKVSIPVSL